MKLVYVFDAYCGWSHGFSGTLSEVASRHPGLPVEVVSGGLFTGSRRVPVRQFGYVQGANAKIAELTGAEFGEAYERLIADGSFVMDSEAAARGVAALRQVAPARAAELAIALQRAFYVDGLSLSEAATYRKVAQAAGLDADAVVAAFEAPGAPAAAHADFRRAVQLGVWTSPWSPTASRRSSARTAARTRRGSSPDATTGQNGLVQARVFAEVVDITGIVLTKLDGN
ncbi:DsbA family protein, partial [Streptomyces sp. Agncl-13]|uniref:DsbA family protein n=1 Tax=Streptomyces sp. Agncl-13 TaxID=3400628 RepID=UPI003A884F51